jgi:small subunit ribosomal protein S16
VAVKIKLKRLGKIRNPQYRIVVADARAKRDGRSIEQIGVYQPKEEPSLIQVDSDRAQYWLGVGAQPTEAVTVLLKITGDWQKFHGLPGQEGTLRVAAAKADKRVAFEAASKAGEQAPAKPATTPKKRAAAEPDPAASSDTGSATASPASAGPADGAAPEAPAAADATPATEPEAVADATPAEPAQA